MSGAIVATGSATPALTNNGAAPLTTNFDLVTFDVDIADKLLSAGTYWLGLRVTSADPMNQAVYLAYSAAGDCKHARSADLGASWSGIAGFETPCSSRNLSFSIEGATAPPNPVPLPVSAFLLLAGLGGLGAMRRRR